MGGQVRVGGGAGAEHDNKPLLVWCPTFEGSFVRVCSGARSARRARGSTQGDEDGDTDGDTRHVVARRAGRAGRGRGHRHRDRRVLRHAGPVDRQADLGAVVRRRRRRARCRMLQLPAGRRCRQQHRRRLRDLELGDRLRRHGDDARFRDAAPDSVAAGYGAGDGGSVLDGRPAGHPGAAQHPQPPDRPPRRAWSGALCRNRTRVHRVRRHLSRRLGRRIQGPHPRDRLQHRLRDARLDADGAAAARHPARDGRRRHVLRGRQGGVQLRPAGGRVPLRPCPHHLRQPHDLPQRRQGDRRPARQEPDVHGEVR